jgi:RHS repeat-associated protein
VQNLSYTYDPVGNITRIRDDAQQTIYFRNKRVEPNADYTYDAVYRLIEATGREHLSQVGGVPIPHSYNDVPRVGVLHPADGGVMGVYLERYVYDAVGNFLTMQHRGSDPANPGWTRSYAYNEASLLEPAKQSNRLTSTTIGATTETYSAGQSGYDPHGNLLRMPQLQEMQWDSKDQLQMTQRQAVNTADADGMRRQGERTWYVYDSAGQRVRKVTELATGQVKDERVYLGCFEVYRKNGANLLVRETLHIMDNEQRIALVETRTKGSDRAPQQLVRYQFGNHLGSASLELDDQSQIISYEEYTPHGSTAYQAVRNQTETPKRYRYTSKERDDESGLYYYGGRYYAPSFARWLSPDPKQLTETSGPTWQPNRPRIDTNRVTVESLALQQWAHKQADNGIETDGEPLLAQEVQRLKRLVDFPNLYTLVENNPIIKSDPDGRQTVQVPTPLTTSRLRAIAQAQGIGTGLTGIQLNRAVGRAFQDWALRAFPAVPTLQENFRLFRSPAREVATQGRKDGPILNVMPDAVRAATTVVWGTLLGIPRPERTVTQPDSVFVEVKAVNGAITLSHSSHQITGLIDVAANSPAGRAGGPDQPTPAIIFITTGDTTISPTVLAEATRRGVAVWQTVAFELPGSTTAKPSLGLGPVVPLNVTVYGPTVPQPLPPGPTTIPLVPVGTMNPANPDPTEVQ